MTYSTCFSLSIFWRRSPCCRLSSSRALVESSFAFGGSLIIWECLKSCFVWPFFDILFLSLINLWMIFRWAEDFCRNQNVNYPHLCQLCFGSFATFYCLLDFLCKLILREYVNPASHTSLISGCICICICIQPVPRNFSTSGCQLLQPTGSLSCPAQPVWATSSSSSPSSSSSSSASSWSSSSSSYSSWSSSPTHILNMRLNWNLLLLLHRLQLHRPSISLGLQNTFQL